MTRVVAADALAGPSLAADDARGLTVASMLRLDEGPGNFDVRYLRLAPGGQSRDHSHPWEQALFVLEGEGAVELGGLGTRRIGPRDFVYTPPGVHHQIVNDGEHELVLLAIRGPNADPVSPG